MALIRDNLEYEHHMEYDQHGDKELYEEIYETVCDVVCVKRKTICEAARKSAAADGGYGHLTEPEQKIVLIDGVRDVLFQCQNQGECFV